VSVCNGERETGRNTTDGREEQEEEEEKKRHTSKRRTAVAAEKRTNGRKKTEKESLAPAKRLSVFLFCVDGGVGCFLFSFSSMIREL
jgi:hypothetical protein